MAQKYGRAKNSVRPLSPRQLDVLREILQNRAPDLVGQLQMQPSTEADRCLVLEMMDVLGDVLCERGLNVDHEPNSFGLEIEELIGEFSLRAQELEALSPLGTDTSQENPEE